MCVCLFVCLNVCKQKQSDKWELGWTSTGMKGTPVSCKNTLNRIKGNWSVIFFILFISFLFYFILFYFFFYFELNATLCWHICKQIIDPWGAQGIAERHLWYLLCLKFMSSAPLKAFVCIRSILRKYRRAFSGDNFIIKCYWISEVRITGTQSKRTYLQPRNIFYWYFVFFHM